MYYDILKEGVVQQMHHGCQTHKIWRTASRDAAAAEQELLVDVHSLH
jgi:hypothetical protein